MKKKLPAHDIANELSGSSVFFSPKEQSKSMPRPKSFTETDATADHETKTTTRAIKPHSDESTPSSNHDTVTPRNHDTKPSSDHTQSVARNHPTTTPLAKTNDISPDMLEEVRKMVRQLGKEAATHRFTSEEKRTIADLVYTYHRQGYRTSENEITRIAVNWILLDFRERGEQSVLARMLELLHG